MNYARWNRQSDCGDAQVTVFCAVWHRQKNKLQWLRSHYRNLRAQSLGVRIVYVFDNGDTPPDWLDADVYVFSEPLSIYEAWAAAVAFNDTPYLMNLNIDDRLATNAVELLLGAACASSAVLVGGEWLIRFDDAHCDRAFAAPDLSATVFKGEWPPQKMEGLRLGSGTGERGTFGPATLWNASVIGKYYPSHFTDGSPVKSMGDAFFWSIITNNKLRAVRLPLVIGKYLSSPIDQAEFRANDDWELLNKHGLSRTCFADRILSGEVAEVSCAALTLPPLCLRS